MNQFDNKRSEFVSNGNPSKRRIVYPSWKSLIREYLDLAYAKNPEMFTKSKLNFDSIFSSLDLVRQVTSDKDPNNLVLFMYNASADYIPKTNLSEVMESFKQVSVRQNEFYAIFDFQKFGYSEVDRRIYDILGIRPHNFTVAAMAGLDPSNPLFHPRDNNHLLRWTALTYYMLSIDLFKWNSMEDQYCVKFRVGTTGSDYDYYKEEGYAALEKLCFLYCDESTVGPSRPIYHFDKWLVFNKSEFDNVKPKWLSIPSRENHLNIFNYLIHAYLLDIPINHLLLLHLRQNHDRNKAIAVSLNEMVLKSTGIVLETDEHHVGDCFAKTIRGKMANLMNVWDKRSEQDLQSVQSDAQAVDIAKALGLLPIPEKLLPLILNNVTEL